MSAVSHYRHAGQRCHRHCFGHCGCSGSRHSHCEGCDALGQNRSPHHCKSRRDRQRHSLLPLRYRTLIADCNPGRLRRYSRPLACCYPCRPRPNPHKVAILNALKASRHTASGERSEQRAGGTQSWEAPHSQSRRF